MKANNTPATMNANETTAPEFSELSHTATNIVLTAENDGDIYRRHVQPLISSLAKKLEAGKVLTLRALAESAVMAVIIRESIKGMKAGGWDIPVNTADRKQAAAYLANVYMSDAYENA